MRRQVLRLLAIALAVHAGVSAAAAPLCHHSSAAAPALVRLREALAHGRFVAYQPTALKVVDGRFSNADPASIRADLEVLRGHFDSLVTYDAVHGAPSWRWTCGTSRGRCRDRDVRPEQYGDG